MGQVARVRPVLVVEVLWGAWNMDKCLWLRTSSMFRCKGEKNLQYHSLIPHSVENTRKPETTEQKLLMQIISGDCPGMLQHPGVSAGT